LIGFLLASFIGILIGKKFINFMKMRQFGQIIRNDGPESHFKKAGTPTMGGFMIFFALFVSLAVVGNFGSLPLLGVIAITFSYFVLGFMDDYLKVLKKNTKGVSGKAKLVWQFATAIIVSYIFIKQGVVDTKLYIPFVKGPVIDLGHFYVFFMALVIVGSSNAVNLTDGLDGLAVGPVITSAISLGLLSYVAGHREIANYLLIPYVESVGELTVFAAVLIGAAIGFLWFNSYPAQIFMGDVGSLAMGGALGTMAVLTKNEVLYILIGGIFVIEALSVIIQVASYKLRKKRIFKMAPIHHHFELSGWPEPKVIVRFWIISAFLAIVSIATLKLR
jgi:phospho-N-acetylmuramoyl-pentapeptide-transferase